MSRPHSRRCVKYLLKQCLDHIPDHRRAQGRMYDLPHLLLFCILGLTAGAKSYRQLHQYIRAHLPRLQTEFGCRWRRVPAYTAIRYALRHLDVQAVSDALEAHAAAASQRAMSRHRARQPSPLTARRCAAACRSSRTAWPPRCSVPLPSTDRWCWRMWSSRTATRTTKSAAAQPIETLGLSRRGVHLDACTPKKHSTPSSTAITT
ncbi:transposase family protein [Plasticicumulans sp.]|uniref:transposase family protein n=1 Tax=Plasticicumulans sp. TaxID=2307179 RepID=UPI003964795A